MYSTYLDMAKWGKELSFGRATPRSIKGTSKNGTLNACNSYTAEATFSHRVPPILKGPILVDFQSSSLSDWLIRLVF